MLAMRNLKRRRLACLPRAADDHDSERIKAMGEACARLRKRSMTPMYGNIAVVTGVTI